MHERSRSSALDDHAISQLFRQERLGLLRLAMLLTGDRGAAEDLVQDAFVGLQRRWRTMSDPAAAGGYLRVSVVNGARSLYRRAAVARRHPVLVEPEAGPGADVAIHMVEEHRLLIAAVRRLPSRQREVLVLRYWADMSEAQIASTLNISVGTVKSSASRALDHLERDLEVNNE